mmetsp:Transcript_79490/g.125363  ORF Transcript_79490/g.125363 Transcript_79490/m.125363 type:complete len:857 (+) Transcript_79490:65-2635(+)
MRSYSKVHVAMTLLCLVALARADGGRKDRQDIGRGKKDGWEGGKGEQKQDQTAREDWQEKDRGNKDGKSELGDNKEEWEDAQESRNRKKEGWNIESPDWANKGNGREEAKDGRPRKSEPPLASFVACENSTEGQDCGWASPRNHNITGTCERTRDEKLHCPPLSRREWDADEDGWKRGRGRKEESSNSSIVACIGKDIEELCTFRPPVFGDQELVELKKGGHLRHGQEKGKELKNRRGPHKAGRSERIGVCVPMKQTDGETTTSVNFCRALPAAEATDACVGSLLDDKCSFLTNGTDTYIHLQVITGQQDQAETKGDVLASFFVHGEWTDPEIFINGGSTQNETNSKVFVLAGWPSKVTLTTWSNDGWCFWKALVNGTTILEDPKGPSGSDAYRVENETSTFKDSQYWIEGPPSSQIFHVAEDSIVQSSTQSQQITLKIYTAANPEAGTQGSVLASFFVKGEWTDREVVFTGADSGDEKSKAFTLAGWPEKIWVGTDSADPYSYVRITINEKAVIEDPSGFGGNGQDFDPLALGSYEGVQQFWIASPPSSQTLQIPGVSFTNDRNGVRHRLWGSCQETWWDVLNGTLHCRPEKKSWTPSFRSPKHQGNKSRPNAMEPDFAVKSDAEAASIHLQMVISNLDYNKLQQDRAARLELTKGTQEIVAASAGDAVYPQHVTIDFLPGSVIASCEINPPEYVSRRYIKQKLEADTSLPQNLVTLINNNPALVVMTTGTVSVSTPTISVIEQAPSEESRERRSKRIIRILMVVSSALFVCALCSCFVALILCRKMRIKGGNAQIHANGTTVAVGRPVAQGEQKGATVGTPVTAAQENQEKTNNLKTIVPASSVDCNIVNKLDI